MNAVAEPTSAVIGTIEKTLRDIWVAADDGSEPKWRVCTMNLVVAAESREIADRYVVVVDEVTGAIPSRAIIVALDPDAETSSLEGDATAVCSPGAGGATCSERVRLVARGAVCARVASAVEALLVPELSTTLVWLGRVHADDDVFRSMAKGVQRVVLDTEYTSISSLLALARWVHEDSSRPAVADLAWTRLATWQELCARFFDEPALMAHARGVTRVSIRQASESGARIGSEAALLLGWLATKLGWRSVRVGGTLRFRRPDGVDVTLDLHAVHRPDGVAPAALAGVRIESDAGGVKSIGTIDRDLASGASSPGKTPDADVVTWRLAGDGRPEVVQRVRLRDNRGARVLERTLHRPMHDPTLGEAIVFAEQAFEHGVVVR